MYLRDTILNTGNDEHQNCAVHTFKNSGFGMFMTSLQYCSSLRVSKQLHTPGCPAGLEMPKATVSCLNKAQGTYYIKKQCL